VVAKHSSVTKHSTDFNKIGATENITYIPHNIRKATETATLLPHLHFNNEDGYEELPGFISPPFLLLHLMAPSHWLITCSTDPH
jgi:hypothetical protein